MYIDQKWRWKMLQNNFWCCSLQQPHIANFVQLPVPNHNFIKLTQSVSFLKNKLYSFFSYILHDVAPKHQLQTYIRKSFQYLITHFTVRKPSIPPISDPECCSVQLPVSTCAPNMLTAGRQYFFLYVSKGFKKESPGGRGGLQANPILSNLLTSLTHLSATYAWNWELKESFRYKYYIFSQIYLINMFNLHICSLTFKIMSKIK